MRSRYTAYVLGDEAHLARTWDPRTRPEGPCTDPGTTWTGLSVHEVLGGGASEEEGAEAVVEFTARYAVDGRAGLMRERSRFRRRAGRWLYVEAL